MGWRRSNHFNLTVPFQVLTKRPQKKAGRLRPAFLLSRKHVSYGKGQTSIPQPEILPRGILKHFS
jgi:hypothetical protein